MENEIKLIGTVNFMGMDIPNIVGGFGKDKKVITDKTIGEIHGMKMFKVRERINDNKKRFKEGVDYLDIKRILEADTLQQLGYAKQTITQADNIYLLSERGYAKLIKIMDTDKAWDIHDQLMEEYFTMREQLQSNVPTLTQEQSLVLNVFANRNNPTEFALALGQLSDYKFNQGGKFICDESVITLPKVGEMILDTLENELKKLNYLPTNQVMGGEFVKFLTRQGYFELKRFPRVTGVGLEKIPHTQPTQLFYDMFVEQSMAIARKVNDKRGKVMVQYTNNIYKYIMSEHFKVEFMKFIYNSHQMLVMLMESDNSSLLE